MQKYDSESNRRRCNGVEAAGTPRFMPVIGSKGMPFRAIENAETAAVENRIWTPRVSSSLRAPAFIPLAAMRYGGRTGYREP